MKLKELLAAGLKEKQRKNEKQTNVNSISTLHDNTNVKARKVKHSKRIDRGASRGG